MFREIRGKASKWIHPYGHFTTIFSTLKGRVSGAGKNGGYLSIAVQNVFCNLTDKQLKDIEFGRIQKQIIREGNKLSTHSQSINVEYNEELDVFFRRKAN